MPFRVLTHGSFLDHHTPLGHPERPERLTALYAGLEGLSKNVISSEVVSRSATEDELSLVHGAVLIDRISATAGKEITQIDPDTFTSSHSYEAARLAVGGLLGAVDAAIGEPTSRCLALIRPPGHHAEKDRAMGFCLFNNVAVAAEYAIRKKGFQRVAIYDFDVHHGNGTQSIFYDRPDVLYLSHHQYPFYPGSGDWHEVGTGAGAGRTLNVPLAAGAGDQEVHFIWHRIFKPVLEQFQPQILFLSAGFDGHLLDPIASLKITSKGFGRLFQHIEQFARALSIPLIYALEGGYNLKALQELAPLLVNSGTHDETELPNKNFGFVVCPPILDEARRMFGPYWKI